MRTGAGSRAQETSASRPLASRWRRGLCPRAPGPLPRDMPPSSVGERDSAPLLHEPAGWRQSPPVLGRMLPARARPTPAVRSVCLAGRAPGSRRLWSVARVEGSGPLHRQPFASLCSPSLQNLPSALRLHALSEAVRLCTPTPVRLERPLHDGDPLSTKSNRHSV